MERKKNRERGTRTLGGRVQGVNGEGATFRCTRQEGPAQALIDDRRCCFLMAFYLTGATHLARSSGELPILFEGPSDLVGLGR